MFFELEVHKLCFKNKAWGWNPSEKNIKDETEFNIDGLMEEGESLNVTFIKKGKVINFSHRRENDMMKLFKKDSNYE